MGTANGYSDRVVYGNYVYGLIENAGYMRCISLLDGSIQWTYNLPNAMGSLVASDNKVIVYAGTAVQPLDPDYLG